MKKILFLLMLAASFSFRAGAANGDERIPETAIQSFRKMFGGASEVTWSQAEMFYRADFQFNGQYIQALYSCGGELIAMKKNVTSTQLPVLLGVSLRQEYGQFWISTMEEVSTEGGVYYLATLENGHSRIQLRSAINTWEQVHTTRK